MQKETTGDIESHERTADIDISVTLNQQNYR